MPARGPVGIPVGPVGAAGAVSLAGDGETLGGGRGGGKVILLLTSMLSRAGGAAPQDEVSGRLCRSVLNDDRPPLKELEIARDGA